MHTKRCETETESSKTIALKIERTQNKRQINTYTHGNANMDTTRLGNGKVCTCDIFLLHAIQTVILHKQNSDLGCDT